MKFLSQLDKMKFLSQLDKTKFKINGSGGIDLIKMDLFLSFLTVPTERIKDCFGSDNNWTEHVGDDGLVLRGGLLRTKSKEHGFVMVEYLDSLRYKKNLDNSYNDFVNPLHLFPIMNQKGREFFIRYYDKDIRKLLSDAVKKCKAVERATDELLDFWSQDQYCLNDEDQED